MKYKHLALGLCLLVLAAGCGKKAADNQQNNNTSETQTQQQNQSSNNQQTADAQNQQTQQNSAATQTPKQGGTLENDLHFSGEGDVSVEQGQPEVFQIDITSTGFSPSSLRVKQGDYVQFVNKDSGKHWPASDPHPTHTALPGFDAKKGLGTNEKYVYQFNKVGTWGFHDHMNPSFKGSITVQ